MKGIVSRQATLLRLPRELRLLILEDAIAVRRPAPAAPSTSQDRAQFRNRHDPRWSEETVIYIENDARAQSAQASVLATCRQLREEAQYILELVKDEPYVLDVMLVDHCGLMPTWVSFPRLSRRIKHVDIRIRLFKLPDNMNPRWVKNANFDGGHDGSVRTEWNLCALFTAYLLEVGWRGPGLLHGDISPPASDDEEDPVEHEEVPEWKDWLRERRRWTAIDAITVTVEDSEIPMEPLDDGGELMDVFAHTIFRGDSDWPPGFAPPENDPGRAYGPHFGTAQTVWNAVTTMSRGEYTHFVTCELMVTNIGLIDIMVGEDYEYTRCDITTGFCQEFGYYESQNNFPPHRQWMVKAAERRRRLGMWDRRVT